MGATSSLLLEKWLMHEDDQLHLLLSFRTPGPTPPLPAKPLHGIYTSYLMFQPFCLTWHLWYLTAWLYGTLTALTSLITDTHSSLPTVFSHVNLIYERCPESMLPFGISQGLVAWPWCNLAASQRRPYCASVNSHSPVGLVSRQWDATDWACVLCDRHIKKSPPFQWRF